MARRWCLVVWRALRSNPRGEDIWYANALGQAEKNTSTFDCGPCRLYMNHYSVPVEWLKLVELTDEYAIFKVWPTE